LAESLGRPLKKRVIKDVVAGVAFVLGALNAIGGEETILRVIQEGIEKTCPDGSRIFGHNVSTILRYIRTLFFLPVFNKERPIELDSYEGKTLGLITSSDGIHVKYRTTDRFLRELTSLSVGDDMTVSLAARYFKTFYDIDDLSIYVDGHFKAVWTLKNTPRGKHGMMDIIMHGREQIFLNGHDGHPLIHRTCPADRHLTKELMQIVKELEDAIGREVVNVIVVDGECCSLEILKKFDKINKSRTHMMYPITVLDSNQYHIEDFKVRDGDRQRPVEDSDFVPFKTDKKGRVKSWIALVEFDYLSNANRRRKEDEEYPVRCAVVKKRNGNLTVMVTTMPYDEITSGAELADLYYNRWPCQEAIFKEMKRYCNLDVNHGFRKMEVYNRMAYNKLEKVERSLNYDLKRLNNLKDKLECVENQMEKRRSSMMKGRYKVVGQIDKIREKIRNCVEDDSKQRARLEKKAGELRILEDKYHEKIGALKEKERALVRLEKKILKSIDKNKENAVKWNKTLDDSPFYEIDPEMDHIMTNFKILYENSLRYVKDTFFGSSVGMETLLRWFINHYGDLEILDDGKRHRFKLNRFDGKEWVKKARRACEIFNAKEIRTTDGILLEIAVKR
jgi:hypothetical protein